MRILVIPMFALSRMDGPWSRAQKIATAFAGAGHDVMMGVAPDGNCRNPVASNVLALPAPSPMGLPMVLASKAFPVANRIGIAGRKPVNSFEEVLWIKGALSYDYEARSVELLRRCIRDEHVDAVYSEFSLPAVIAAQAEGVPCVGTASYPTQASYACDPSKAKGVRRLLSELALPDVVSSLELFRRMERRFVPSCPKLEPFEDEDVVFCGFLNEKAVRPETPRDARRGPIVIYMGTGSVARPTISRIASELAKRTDLHVYVAGMAGPPSEEGRLHMAGRFDFSELLPQSSVFVNHGGQNSIMDALACGVPQAIFPGKVFERLFNAQSVEGAGAGVQIRRFNEPSLLESIHKVVHNESIADRAAELRNEMLALGGASAVVAEVERLLS